MVSVRNVTVDVDLGALRELLMDGDDSWDWLKNIFIVKVIKSKNQIILFINIRYLNQPVQ